MSDQTEPTPAAPPNYAARRMLVSAVVITAIAALGLVAWQVVGGESESVDAIESRWDRIALIDRSAGRITTVDTAGELVDEVTGLGPVRSSTHAAGHLALTGFNAVTILDVAQLTESPWVFDLAPRATVVQVPTTDHLLLATVPTNGGDITLFDTSIMTSFDIGELAGLHAPLFFAGTIRTNPSGTRIAVADAGTFQTILVDTLATDDDRVTFYPDQPVAVGDELIATSQVRGGSAEIALFGRDGVRRTTVTSALPAGGLFHGDELVYVTVDGQILRVTADSKEPELLGEVALPAGTQVRSVTAALDGERLIVFGDTFETVVDLDGTVIFTTTFTDTLAPLPASTTWRCLPVGGGDSFHSLIDLADGEPIADLTGVSVTGTSVDGCTVIGQHLGIGEIVSANGVIQLPRGHTSTLGPDGTALVWITPSGAIQLVRIDDDFALTDPIDLSEFTGTNPQIAFVSG